MEFNGIESVYVWHVSQPTKDEVNGLSSVCDMLVNPSIIHPHGNTMLQKGNKK